MLIESSPAATECHDSRGTGGDQLCYPHDAVVVLLGIPGAGKSTLLHRLSATAADTPLPDTCGGVRIVDSEQQRFRWRRHVGEHYAWWRPAVHAVHYARVAEAIRRGGPVVVSDCGTRPWVRTLLGRLVAHECRPLHLVLLDASPEQAQVGQRERGRSVGTQSFHQHCRRWRTLLAVAERDGDPARLVHGARSVVVVDRQSAARLRAVSFIGGPESDYGVVAELRSSLSP
jgi:hypothetical protein